MTKQASRGYINYQEWPLVNWQQSYFGPNVQRLASVKATYDQLGLFSKKLIVQGLGSVK